VAEDIRIRGEYEAVDLQFVFVRESQEQTELMSVIFFLIVDDQASFSKINELKELYNRF
jgi:hypothetical protein